MARTEELVDLVIESSVSLRPGATDIEVETIVHNVAEDHRLRVLFPTNVDGRDLSGRYAVRCGGAAHRAERRRTICYRELEVETKPQQSWTAVFQEGRGLAVVSTGLLETAVRDNPERTLALTLLRSTRPRWARTASRRVCFSATTRSAIVSCRWRARRTGCTSSSPGSALPPVSRPYSCAMRTFGFTAWKPALAGCAQLPARRWGRGRHQRANGGRRAGGQCSTELPSPADVTVRLAPDLGFSGFRSRTWRALRSGAGLTWRQAMHRSASHRRR